ncbi:maleylacetate reductase [Nocardia sp. NPDC004860]|uniref:maleylacetate reductase n=1 Tax=Nocardia sp. NPDC004860 TaxID=3154557 RepID=UPI0033B1140D
MIGEFDYTARPVRVVFGDGRFGALGAEAQRAGLRRIHLIAGQRLSAVAHELLGDTVVAHTPTVLQHVPAEEVDKGTAVNRSLQVDGYVAVGGGSAIGLAKAFALQCPAPILAVPTTFSGSEMSPIWGTTENGVKVTGRDDSVAPAVVLYDPELYAGLPHATAVTSVFNAMAHAVEALYAADGSPLVALIAEEAVRLLGGAVTRFGTAEDRPAKAEAVRGAWLAGMCLGSVSMALHHKICHTLGGTFGLPHAETHTVMLPYSLAYNAAAAPAAVAAVGRALGAENPVTALARLMAAVGAPTTLCALGFAEHDIEHAVELATRAPYPNPAPVTPEGIRGLLTAAFHGRLE